MEENEYIYGQEGEKDFFDTKFGNALLGSACGLGILGCLAMIFICILRSIGG